MRPLSIRVEGFSAYRGAVEVDLEGVEFFSLSGATGSGKSSLVDAMVFALYGRVPRLGARAVAPAITAGADRARVAFDFDVGGTRYTVVRQAVRNKSGGASIKEARLQQGAQVLADGAKDVTDAVESLLRLRFEDFTRTVVLPQGDFARFLTADKAERQALLRNLLGLDVYATMRSLARTRESVARDRVEVAQAQLDALEVPSPDITDMTRQRLESLEELASVIVASEKELADLEENHRAAQEVVGKLDDASERLAGLRSPEQLEELDSLVVAARDALATADEDVETARDEVGRLEGELAGFPPREVIAGLKEAHGRLGDVERRLASLDDRDARERVQHTETSLADSKDRLQRAQETLETAKVSHAAHALGTTLVVGEPCPVCHHEVSTLPVNPAPAELVELEAVRADAAVLLEQASASADSARTALATLETTRAEVEDQRSELANELADAATLDDLIGMETGLTRLGKELQSATGGLVDKEAIRRRTQAGLEELSETIRSVGRELMAARQVVADLEPPLPESDDAIVQWKELLTWRDERRRQVDEERREAVATVRSAGLAVETARSSLLERLKRSEVPRVEPYAVEVTRELQVVKTAVAEAEKAVADAERLGKQIDEANAEAAIAGSLAGHLKADGFERWLMAGAIADLVAGANDRLGQLSGGGYSLHADEAGAFSIVDHHNADEIRSVVTLSGGETFLVSLALALSLAETLAARGGADLDAIIVDEGFGTLDDESLDTVASVLEDLSGGLMVGVITHVKELAARASVRFEVTSEPTGSNVVMIS